MKDNTSIISHIAICLSALSLIAVLSRFLEIRIYDASYLISVLSILVTVLIGWNIYSVVDINKKSIKIRKFLNEADKIKEDIYNVRNESQAALFYLQGNIRLRMESCHEHLFTYYIYQSALWYALMQNDSFSIGLIPSILKEMKILIKRFKDDENMVTDIGNIELTQLKDNMKDISKSGNPFFSVSQREQFMEIIKEIRKLL